MDQRDLEFAIAVAVDAHEGQVDKGGEPYILHPLRVMDAGKTIEQRIVGVLHDVVEDCNVELDLIHVWFGPTICAGVDAVTKRPGVETYGEFMERAASLPLAANVKLADIYDNLRPSRQRALEPSERKGMTKRYIRSIPLLTGRVSTWAAAGDWVKEHNGTKFLHEYLLETGVVRP